MLVRSSAHRWRSLSRLLSALERVLEGTARLDAYAHAERTVGPDICARMDVIAARIDQEVDRLTAELLAEQLAEKIARRSVA